jgi:hypothetical protein
MKFKVPSDLYNIVEETVAPITDINSKKLKQHTKIIVDKFNIPYYTYGISELNNFCPLHYLYSIKNTSIS